LRAPYLEVNGTDIIGATEPKRAFVGTAREAACGFPPMSMAQRHWRLPGLDQT
jgi:hypothetical protein